MAHTYSIEIILEILTESIQCLNENCYKEKMIELFISKFWQNKIALYLLKYFMMPFLDS